MPTHGMVIICKHSMMLIKSLQYTHTNDTDSLFHHSAITILSAIHKNTYLYQSAFILFGTATSRDYSLKADGDKHSRPFVFAALSHLCSF